MRPGALVIAAQDPHETDAPVGERLVEPRQGAGRRSDRGMGRDYLLQSSGQGPIGDYSDVGGGRPRLSESPCPATARICDSALGKGHDLRRDPAR